MMTSITPVGEMARQQRWGITTAAYLMGSAVGGAAVGLVLGVVSVPVRAALPAPLAWGLLALVAVLGLAADVGPLALPTRHRQVDEAWLTRYRGWVYGLGFGAQLGSGVVTIVTSSLTYVVLAAAALSGSVAAGVAIGATFGLVRALPVLGFARVRSPGGLRTAMRRVEAWRGPVDRGVVVVQSLAAATAALFAIGEVAPWP